MPKCSCSQFPSACSMFYITCLVFLVQSFIKGIHFALEVVVNYSHLYIQHEYYIRNRKFISFVINTFMFNMDYVFGKFVMLSSQM